MDEAVRLRPRAEPDRTGGTGPDAEAEPVKPTGLGRPTESTRPGRSAEPAAPAEPAVPVKAAGTSVPAGFVTPSALADANASTPEPSPAPTPALASGFSHLAILTGTFQLFYFGVTFAGPGYWWSWPMLFLGQLMVALCFCEQAARHSGARPVRDGVKELDSPYIGRLGGWMTVAATVLSLSSVALACQFTLPRISRFFQFVETGAGGTHVGVNAVLLGSVLVREIVLWCVVITITVCALAVHAAGIRLIRAMARDSRLPGSSVLARVSPRFGTPVVPAVVVGLVAVGVLLIHINQPRILAVVAGIAVIMSCLAHLTVTLPMLVRRLRGTWQPSPEGHFSLGRFGPAVNLFAVLWGIGMSVNLAWPRSGVSHAVFVGIVAAGGIAYCWYARRDGSRPSGDNGSAGPVPAPCTGVRRR